MVIEMKFRDCVFAKPIPIITGGCELCPDMSICIKIRDILQNGYQVSIWWDDTVENWRIDTPVEKAISLAFADMDFEMLVEFTFLLEKSPVLAAVLNAFNFKSTYTSDELVETVGCVGKTGRKDSLLKGLRVLRRFGIITTRRMGNKRTLVTAKLRGT